MAKSIKVEDHVYQQLYEFQEKGETFSQAIETLIAARTELCRCIDLLEGLIRFREWQNKQKELARDAESPRH